MAKQDNTHYHISVPMTILWTVLISIAGFCITLNTRVAVLESSNNKIEQQLIDMSTKIDKIYDKITFEHNRYTAHD